MGKNNTETLMAIYWLTQRQMSRVVRSTKFASEIKCVFAKKMKQKSTIQKVKTGSRW